MPQNNTESCQKRVQDSKIWGGVGWGGEPKDDTRWQEEGGRDLRKSKKDDIIDEQPLTTGNGIITHMVKESLAAFEIGRKSSQKLFQHFNYISL